MARNKSAVIPLKLPPAMKEEVEKLAKREHRYTNDLVREALRRYIEAAKHRDALLERKIKGLDDAATIS